MGCKNTKVHGIPGQRTLDELPPEIIYKILDQLDIRTIFQSLYHVCKRFDQILLGYDEYHLNLKLLSLKHFYYISSRIRPEQITQLTLSDDETSPGLVELFLSKFSVNTLVRLRALSLRQINNEELISEILIPIADHASLLDFSSITIINDDESYSDIFTELLMSIVAKPSLRKIYLDLSYSRTTANPLPWSEPCTIQHMTLIGTCAVSFLRNTFTHVPQLETLITDDFDFYDESDLNDSSLIPADDDDSEDVEIQLNGNVNNEEPQTVKKAKIPSFESIDHLTSLTLNSCSFNMSKLQWLLQEIPTLKQFSLVTTPGHEDESILDGSRWEKLVPHLHKFQFVFSVSLSDSSEWDSNACLLPFQQSFWTEVKQWFVALEKYDDMVLLYTLPYTHATYVMRNETNPVEYHSTAPRNSSLQSESMKNVRDLYIDTSETLRSSTQNRTLPRFTHITNLILHGKWSQADSFLTDLSALVDLSTVQELTRTERIRTVDTIALVGHLSNLQSIRTTTAFLDALNAAKFSYPRCLREFIVDPDYSEDHRVVNVEPFCAMFPRVQNVHIPVDSVDSCKYVLEQLKADLVSVIFQIPDGDSLTDSDDSDDDNDTEAEDEENSTTALFTEWIKELPKDYRSYRKQRHIHIALK